MQIQTISSFFFVSFCFMFYLIIRASPTFGKKKKKFSIIPVAQETFNKFLIRFFHILSPSSLLPVIPPSSLSSFVLFCFCLLLLLLLSSSCFPSSHFVIPYRVVLFHHEMFFTLILYLKFYFNHPHVFGKRRKKRREREERRVGKRKVGRKGVIIKIGRTKSFLTDFLFHYS